MTEQGTTKISPPNQSGGEMTEQGSTKISPPNDYGGENTGQGSLNRSSPKLSIVSTDHNGRSLQHNTRGPL
jgi:hypothetical protein